MYGEKPKTYPAATEGHTRPVMCRQSRKAVHPLRAGDASWITFHVADGPSVRVTGDNNRLGSGIEVDHWRLKPSGTNW
jgi:hypothetical protein